MYLHVSQYPLAFEATLSPNLSQLRLTIVAQGKYVTEAHAYELLADFAKALKEVLEDNATQVIPINEEARDALVAEVTHINGKAIETDASLCWTQEAITIRQELAALAKFDESAINYRSSIFEIGLDSIDIIKLSSRLKRAGIGLPVSRIIKAQTIEHMITEMNAATVKNATQLTNPQFEGLKHDLWKYVSKRCSVKEIEAVLPATPLQGAMINEMINSDYHRYFNIDAFKLDTEVDLLQLQGAIEQVIVESPILRTTFLQVEDATIPSNYAQIVRAPGSDYAKHIVTNEEWSKKHDADDGFRSFSEGAVRSAMEHNKLLQLHLVRSATVNYLFMAISHALYDGTSLRALHTDIARAYDGSYSRRPDYVPLLEQVLQSTTPAATSFWRASLSKLPRIELSAGDFDGLSLIHI